MPSLIVTICAMMLAAAQGSTNFSGKWSMPQAGRNGARSVSVLTINQGASAISGTLTSGRADLGTGSPVNTEIFGGKVEGDTITFYVWRGTDKPAKQFYKGVMHGDEIDFTVTGGPAPTIVPPNAPPPAASTQITAKRTVE